VCDSPDEFYDIIESLAAAVGIDSTAKAGPHGVVRDWLNIYAGEGLGYGLATQEELKFLYDVSSTTGVLFDQVYSGKALYYFHTLAAANPEVFRAGQNVLFIHTGGAFGVYACADELANILPADQASELLT
jgi:D-cysteine desulfhydrase